MKPNINTYKRQEGRRIWWEATVTVGGAIVAFGESSVGEDEAEARAYENYLRRMSAVR